MRGPDARGEPLVWAEIDLAAYAHNLRELRRLLAPEVRLMPVVKADGYGHGILAVARAAVAEGVDALSVARLEEALELRRAGIEAPILILGYTPPARVRELLDHDLTQTLFSPDTAAALSDAAVALGHRVRVHLKLDTGMGRLGLEALGRKPTATADEILSVADQPGLEVEGVLTHFAAADRADKTSARRQLERFLELLELLRRRGLEFPLRHAANSAALLELPESHLDLVRPGIATYGLLPSSEIEGGLVDLVPVMQWKTRVVQVKRVPAGFAVSYGHTYRTPEPTRLATVAVGYADGLNRRLSSRGRMLVQGRSVPIVGRVCMDLTLVDVGEVAEVTVGEEVVIIGRQGDEVIAAGEIAATLDTISYEVVAGVSGRVPRFCSGP